MRNKLSDLNDHLFEQIERLNDEDLTEEQLEVELKRARGIREISSQIISAGQLTLNAKKYLDEYYGGEDADKNVIVQMIGTNGATSK